MNHNLYLFTNYGLLVISFYWHGDINKSYSRFYKWMWGENILYYTDFCRKINNFDDVIKKNALYHIKFNEDRKFLWTSHHQIMESIKHFKV